MATMMIVLFLVLSGQPRLSSYPFQVNRMRLRVTITPDYYSSQQDYEEPMN